MPKLIQRKWSKLSLLILLISSFGVYSQTQKVTYRVLGISVVGNRSADAGTVISNSGIKINDELAIPGDQTNTAIKHLWGLGIFEDVQIVIEKKLENGIFLQIKVKEYPRLEKIVFHGNNEIKDDDMNKKITIVRGQTLKPQEISRIKSKINSLYEDEGYLNASIEPHIYVFFRADTVIGKEIRVTWRDEKDLSKEYTTSYEYGKFSTVNSIPRIRERSILYFDISEGDEITIQTIHFRGNRSFDEGKLKGEFDDTKEGKWWKFWSSAKFKRDKFEKDKELLTKFYRKNGYRDFNIIHDSLSFSPDKKHVDVIVDVYEGNQYKVRNVIWEGNTVYPEQALSERLDFKKGDTFDYEKFNQNLHYNEKQSDVSSLYQDNGYLGFNIDAKEEKVSNDTVDIRIKIIEGSRFKIGKVDITGNEKTKDKVIRRELYTLPGSYFSRGFILRSIQQLANLQYFNVENLYKSGVDYRPVNDSTVNIIYKVDEKSSDYLNASVGYSGTFGFSGALGFTLSNFSLAEPFQLGGGQNLNFNWQFGVGNYYRTFSLGFTEPWFMDTPTAVGFDLFDTQQNYVYELRQTGFSIRGGRRLTWPDDFFSIAGMFRFQYNNVINGNGYYAQGLTRQYTLGATISRTDIDDPIFPSRGSRSVLDAQLSGGPFLPGNLDYYKINLKMEWFKSIFNTNKVVLYSAAEFGYIGELSQGTLLRMNPFDFYYMGGTGLIIATTSLRGYEDRSLGTKDASGNVLGSSVMNKYTSELRFALAREPVPIYLLAFLEAGNVYYDIKSTNLFDLKRSAGVGARILINPIGLIGFDYGYGFDRKSVDGQSPSWVFHFQFGKGF
jgi:outer membrane protein insertion porin family